MAEPRAVFHQKSSTLVFISTSTGLLLVLFVLALVFGQQSPTGVMGLAAIVICVSVLLALVLGCLWLLWKRPAAVVVGPDGLLLALGFRAPMPWSDIARITYEGFHPRLGAAREWLVITPKHGVLAPYRLPASRRLELWNQRRGGLRIGLHGLEGTPEDVIRAIEVYFPVVRP